MAMMKGEAVSPVPLINQWNLSDDDEFSDNDDIIEEFVFLSGCYT